MEQELSRSGHGPDQFLEEDYDLSQREIEILKALNQDGESTVAFQGLKRKLGMHQEILSRSLTRLQRDGLVERTPEGYKLKRKDSALLGEGSERVLPIIRSYLPPSIGLQTLIMSSRGSWFGRLRWLRYSETDAEKVLTWITEDGKVQIELKLTNASITIQARVGESVDMREATIAAHELYGHIANLYTKLLRQNGISFLQIGSRQPTAS